MDSFLAYGSLQQFHIESVHLEMCQGNGKLNKAATPPDQI
jgi:hypothetical protein